MAVPLTPDDATKLVTKLLDLYAQAEADLLEKIAASIQKGIDAPEWEHRQLLEIQRYRREAQATLTRLSRRAAAAGSTAVGAATNTGAATALADLNTSLTPSAAIVGNPVNLDAVAALAADLADITTTTNATILRSVDDIYRRTVADMATQEILGTATRRELAERALQRFAAAGITGFVDKAGRKWEASSYIEMASRAATMNAAIAGHAQQLQSQGHDLVMISDVPQECKRCRPWEGRIVSLGGTVAGSITPDGKKVSGSLAQARAEGLFHPNCRHSIAAYFPGITNSFGETADPQGDKDRQRLRLLERRLRAAKREAAVALTPAGGQLSRAKVRDLQAQIREHVATTTAKRQPHREKVSGEFNDVTTMPPVRPRPSHRERFDSTSRAEDVLRGQEPSKLTDTERGTIESYALGGYQSINRALRGKTEMTETIADRVATIRQALRKYPLPEPVRVTREIDAAEYGLTQDTVGDLAGATIDELGFMSTSTRKNPPRSTARIVPVTLEVMVPKGTPALKLGKLAEFPDESEALIIDGRRMVIVEAYKETPGDQVGSRMWRVLAVMLGEGG